MRFLVLLGLCVASLLAGCPLGASQEADFGADPGGDDGVGSGAPQFCMTDAECELAASSCCECPSFATNRADPTNDACTGVACPNPPVCAANVRAACDPTRNQCTIACVEMTCATSCPDGFAIDPATGCLSCACAPAPTAQGCAVDGDCVQAREDCCGCARGGNDTAVLASAAAAYDQMLLCPQTPQCPGVDTCDPAAEPRCIQGTCVLTPDALPPGACAAPGTCADRCVVNRDPAASTHGVGVCVPP